MSKVNTFGFEIVLPKPLFSKACISAFNTPEPVLFKIPIPLVAPAAEAVKSATESDAPPRAALEDVIALFAVVPPIIPPMDSACL